MTGDYVVVIIVTALGFGALAAMLLVPVYRFLRMEDRMLEEVTTEELEAEARRRDQRSGPAALADDQPPLPATTPES